ncbi:MAG: hypothetical protein L3K13_04475 [Thermoplasmata archaeon]|nr:hypothetical protein [Thermoplasmata archaeon]
MRTTYFTAVELRRKIPYDPNFHGLVEKRVEITLDVDKSELQDALFRIKLRIRFVLAGSDEEMGFVSATAESRITGMAPPRTPEGTLDSNQLSPEFMRVVDGAVGEDMLIPLSILARQAHLPSLLPIPEIIRRPATLPSSEKPTASPRAGTKRLAKPPIRRKAAPAT